LLSDEWEGAEDLQPTASINPETINGKMKRFVFKTPTDTGALEAPF
jgi:uncharacterized protein YheU (UPF0270 family)